MYNPTEESKNYFDYNSTTPILSEVVEEMIPYLTKYFGNPHSRSHSYGWQAENAVKKARIQIAESIGASPREIIFTSGATESVNLAIKGIANRHDSPHIITSMIEHKCVIESALQCAKVDLVRPNKDGIIEIESIEKLINKNTVLISIGYVNGEIGTIQNIDLISELCKKYKILFHTDAAQALGKIKLNVKNIDLMSLSSHKAHGPKGIGCLYKKSKIRLSSLIHGGGQERNNRSGTLPVHLCVGFGKATEIVCENIEKESSRLWKIHNSMLKHIKNNLSHVYLNGHESQRVPNNMNLSFAYVEGESLIMGLQDIAVSSGSACTSASLEPSYVLKAIGIKDLLAHSSLRISFGRFTTMESAISAAEKIIFAVNKLRDMSPLKEMAESGIDLNSYNWTVH